MCLFVAGPSLLNGWVKFAPRPAGWSSLHVGPEFIPDVGFIPLKGRLFVGALMLAGATCCEEQGGLLCRGQPVRAGSAGQVQQDSSGLEHVILTTLMRMGGKWHLQALGQLHRRRRVKKKKCPPVHLFSEKVLDPCRSGIYIFKLVSGSSLWLRYFSVCCFCAETRSKWVCGVSLCVSPSRAISVSHSLPALPDRRPLGFQSLAFLRGLSAWCRFLGLVAQCGVWPRVLSRDLCGCRGVPPAGGSSPWRSGFWLYCISAPPLSLCGPYFIFLVVENLSAWSSDYSQRCCSMYECSMAVSVGRSELRIFILCCLDWDSKVIFLKTLICSITSYNSLNSFEWMSSKDKLLND